MLQDAFSVADSEDIGKYCVTNGGKTNATASGTECWRSCRLMMITVVVLVSNRQKWYVVHYLYRYCNATLSTKWTKTASSHEGQCISAGYCHAHMVLYVSVVNYDVDSNCMKYFAQLLICMFTFWDISNRNYMAPCGVNCRRIPNMFNALQSTACVLTKNDNSVHIDA